MEDCRWMVHKDTWGHIYGYFVEYTGGETRYGIGGLMLMFDEFSGKIFLDNWRLFKGTELVSDEDIPEVVRGKFFEYMSDPLFEIEKMWVKESGGISGNN